MFKTNKCKFLSIKWIIKFYDNVKHLRMFTYRFKYCMYSRNTEIGTEYVDSTKVINFLKTLGSKRFGLSK